MIEQEQDKPYRKPHVGIYRSQPLTWRDVELDRRLLKHLKKWGVKTESKLFIDAARGYSRVEFDARLEALETYQCIERTPTYRADSLKVSLTDKGKEAALDFLFLIREWNNGGSLRFPRPTLDEVETAFSPDEVGK